MALSFASATVDPTGKLLMSHNVQNCKRVSAGVYLLTYASNFTASSGGPQAASVGTGRLTAINIAAVNTCEVLVTGANGSPQDGPFSFLVMGAS